MNPHGAEVVPFPVARELSAVRGARDGNPIVRVTALATTPSIDDKKWAGRFLIF